MIRTQDVTDWERTTGGATSWTTAAASENEQPVADTNGHNTLRRRSGSVASLGNSDLRPAGRGMERPQHKHWHTIIRSTMLSTNYPTEGPYTPVLIVSGPFVPCRGPFEFPVRMVSPPEQVPACRAHHNTPGTRLVVRETIVLQREVRPCDTTRRMEHSPQQLRFGTDLGLRLLHWSISSPWSVEPIFGKYTFH